MGPTRYRVIDLAVYSPEEPADLIPTSPPLIAIEILSPDDRMSETLQRLQEFRSWGAAHVWLVDPQAQRLYVYHEDGLKQVSTYDIPELRSEIPASDIF